MEIKEYSALPSSAEDIRRKIFVIEQGFAEELEFDENENKATHLVGYIDSKPAATSRFYFEESKNAYLIGRIAVLKEYRTMGLGSKIVKAAEERIIAKKGKAIVIHAQLRVKAFYESLGYSPISEIDLEEGVEHIWMGKTIE